MFNTYLKKIVVGLFLFGWAGSVFAEPVNVILIYADDLGWGDLSCYGHPKFKTPHLDRLAAEGARLTNFYSSYPYCAPARSSLQTGRYPFRNGVTQNPCPDAGINDVGISPDEITLGEAFKAAGYATICIGKWHLGHKPEFHPLRHGYDEYLGILYSNDMHPVELWDGDKVVEYPVIQATLTKRYTDRAIAFMEKNRDRPFFLYLPHAMPHKPLAASEEFYKKTGTGLYGDVLTELDAEIGRLMDRLKALKLDRKTLVIFTSDNGPWYGGSTGGLRGMKGRCWEGGIRVPMIAWWPGKIPAGRVVDEPAIIMDLFVTSLTAAGIDPPSDRTLDGRDILPMLTTKAPSPHQVLLSFRGETLSTVRSGKWKLHLASPGPAREKVWAPDEEWIDPRAPDGVRIIAPYEQTHPSEFPGVIDGDPAGPPGLFDLENDPAEQHNVAAAHPEIVQRLTDLARPYLDEMRRGSQHK